MAAALRRGKWFAEMEGVQGAPGLDLPALDSVAVAAAYGVNATRVGASDDLGAALAAAIASSDPRLIEVEVASGMALT